MNEQEYIKTSIKKWEQSNAPNKEQMIKFYKTRLQNELQQTRIIHKEKKELQKKITET